MIRNHGTDNMPRIKFGLAIAARELVFSSMICSLTGIIMVLLSGTGEWRGFLLASNLNALFSIASIAFGVRSLQPTLRQARYLFLLGPMLCAIAGTLIGLQVSPTKLSGSSWLWLIGMSMLLNLALGGMLYGRAQSRTLTAAWQAEQLRNAAQRQQLLAAQLKMLQAQIEPHFLFNTLANVRTLITLDPAAALPMFDHINDYLRTTLTLARKQHSTLRDEFDMLRHYLAIMQMRMGERLTFSIDCPDELAALPLPPLLVQPLVENAIKHGIEPSINGGQICLSAHTNGDSLQINIADTGLGLSPASGGSNVGLANVRERLHALFGLEAGLVLRNNVPQGLVATLTLPIESATP